MSIGNRIKQLRTGKKFSQEYLAEKLDVSRQAVSKWEQDITKPDTTNIIALAELLDSTVKYLLTGKDDKKEIVYIPVYETKKKMNMKKFAILICVVFIIAIASSFIYWGSTLPVDYDAGACKGGFSTHIFAKYSEELSEMYLDSLDDKALIANYTVIKESYDIGWTEDVISMHFDVSYDHSQYGKVTQRIGFFGKRYWFEKYKWSSPIVVG